MASNRIGRINEEVQRELSELIRSLKDPRVQTMLSITRVDTTSDLRYARVYGSVLEEAREKEAMKASNPPAAGSGASLASGSSCAIRRSWCSSWTIRSNTARICTIC